MVIIAAFVVLAVIIFLVAFNLGKGRLEIKFQTPASPTPNAIKDTATKTASPGIATPVGILIPNGWLTYTNDTYGFSVSYPPGYKALNDAENLYGWPKAVVLIYSGGQSYDLPVEIWDSAAEYQNKYKNQTNVTAHPVKGKVVTLTNTNYLPEVDQIIATFRLN